MTYDDLQAALMSAKADLDAQVKARDTASTLATSAQSRVRDLAMQLEAYKPSSTDQALQRERDAGKTALIDYIKASPAASEADAISQWKVAALKGRPLDRPWLLHDPAALRQEYSANLVAGKYVPDMSWAAFAAFVVATPKDALLAI